MEGNTKKEDMIMAKEGNTKKERIKKLEERFLSLTESVSKVETAIREMQRDSFDVKLKVDRQQTRIDELEKKTLKCFVITIAVAAVSIILCVLLFFMIHSANKKIDTLQEEVQALQSTKVESTQLNATEEFINAIFPMGDRILYDINGNTFYSDPDCKYAITNPEFCSSRCKVGEDSLGNSICIYRLTNGSFAYIPSNFSVNLWWE